MHEMEIVLEIWENDTRNGNLIARTVTMSYNVAS